MQRILVRRIGALGDVILTTPIVARLRAESPDAEIDIETHCPDVYRGNPHINNIGRREVAYDRVINLDMAYERRRRTHQIDAYMEEVFGDHEGPKDVVFQHGTPPQLGCDWANTITLHPATTWPNRMLPVSWWQRVCDVLTRDGYSIVVIGTGMDRPPRGRHVIDTRDRLSLADQAATIQASRVFLCASSGLLSLAAATDTPVISTVTISLPEHGIPYRGGTLGGGYTMLFADIACVGCCADAEPSEYVECKRGDNACINAIDPDRMIEAARRVLIERRGETYHPPAPGMLARATDRALAGVDRLLHRRR